MTTLSAGLINATTLTVTSGASSALTSTNATVTNLTATTVNSTQLNLGNLTLTNNLTVGGTIKGNGVDQTFKDNVSSIVTNNTTPVGRALTGSNNLLPYLGGLFGPSAVVTVNKYGQEWQCSGGKASAFNAGLDGKDGINNYQCMTKTVTAVLYARLKSIGVFPSGGAYAVENLFPTMKKLEFQVPSFGPTQLAGGIANPLQIDLSGNTDKYINFTTARKLYMDDILSESVGFDTGFNHLYAVSNPEAFNYVNSIVLDASGNTTYPRGSITVAGDTFYRPYRAACVAKYDASFNVATGLLTRDALYYTSAFYEPDIATDPITLFNNWLNKFYDSSGATNNLIYKNKVMMYSDNGIFNYNSQMNLGPACMLRAYQMKYTDFSGNYYDLLKKELLTPTNSDLFYYFSSKTDAKFANVATTWKPLNIYTADLDVNSAYNWVNVGGIGTDGSGYIPSSNMSDPIATKIHNRYLASPTQERFIADNAQGYDLTDPSGWRTIFYKTHTLDGSGGAAVPKNYMGQSSILGTNIGYNRVMALIASNGLLPNGTRHIEARDIQNLKIPRVSLNASYKLSPAFGTAQAAVPVPTLLASDENMAYLLSNVFRNVLDNFGLGGVIRGPGYETAIQMEPLNQYGGISTQGSMTVPANSTAFDFYNEPMETFGWSCNTGGGLCYINSKYNAVITVQTQDSQCSMGLEFVSFPIFKSWGNYLMSGSSGMLVANGLGRSYFDPANKS